MYGLRYIALVTLLLLYKHSEAALSKYELDHTELGSETSLRVLEIGRNSGSFTKSGNRVKALLRAFSPILKEDIIGETIHIFEVGKHNVAPLNQAVVNMRVGETRRLGIPIFNYGKIYYEISLLEIL